MPARSLARQIGETSFRWLLAGSILIPLLALAVVAVAEWRRTLAQAEMQVIARVDILHEHAAKLLETLELVLWQADALTAGKSWEEIATSWPLHAALVRTESVLAQVNSVWLTRPDGWTVGGSHSFPLPSVFVGDRDYFQALAAEEHVRDIADTPYVSRAYRGRLTGRPQFNLAIPRVTEGRFDGVITVSAVPGYLENFYAGVDTAAGYSVALIRDDGAMLVRYPPLGPDPPVLSPENPIVRAISSSPDRGLSWAVSELEGTRKLYGWRRVGDFPVHVAFSIPRATILAGWRAAMVRYGAAALAAATGLSALVVGAMRRRRLEIQILENRFHTVQEVSLDGTTLLKAVRDPDGRIVDFAWTYANPAALRMLRVPPGDDLVGQRLLERFPGSDGPDHIFGRYVRVVETGEPEEWEQFYDADGIAGWFRTMVLKVGDGFALVFTDITERRLAQERLRAALAERDRLLAQKELLLKEVNHRVKNSLQLVTSVLNLDAALTDSQTIRRRLDNAVSRVRAIAAVHERLYRSDTVERVEVAPFLAELCGHLAHQSGLPVDAVTMAAEGVELPTDRAAPLALVVNELVTNAVKHGRADDDTLRVEVVFQRIDGSFRLVVRDHGPGLPSGFDPKRAKGLGMRIAHGLAGQLGGTLVFEPAEPGTRVVLVAPLEDVARSAGAAA